MDRPTALSIFPTNRPNQTQPTSQFEIITTPLVHIAEANQHFRQDQFYIFYIFLSFSSHDILLGEFGEFSADCEQVSTQYGTQEATGWLPNRTVGVTHVSFCSGSITRRNTARPLGRSQNQEVDPRRPKIIGWLPGSYLFWRIKELEQELKSEKPAALIPDSCWSNMPRAPLLS